MKNIFCDSIISLFRVSQSTAQTGSFSFTLFG